MGDGQGFFGRFVCSCLFLLGLWGLSTMGLSDCLFVFPSLYFWASLWVFLGCVLYGP